MKPSTGHAIAVAALLVTACVAARLLPHPPNFTPVAAAALFAGFYFPRRWWAIAVVLVAMGIGDLIIGTYQLGVMAAVYAALLLPVLFRRPLRDGLSWMRVGGAAVSAGVLFYLITNAAVWWFASTGSGHPRMYAPDVQGLVASYAAGLPFLKWTIAGNLVWCAAFFGLYALARGASASNALTGDGA